MSITLQETVVVKVSLLGMTEEGMGSAVYEIDMMSLLFGGAAGDVEGTTALAKAVFSALKDAMEDANPHIQEYFREKYTPKNLDNPDGI